MKHGMQSLGLEDNSVIDRVAGNCLSEPVHDAERPGDGVQPYFGGDQSVFGK